LVDLGGIMVSCSQGKNSISGKLVVAFLTNH
jgi:hypothetical protein